MISIYALSPLAAAIILILLGLFVFFKNPGQKVNRIFLISNLVIAGWLLGCFGESNIIKNADFLLWWDKALNVFAVFSPALFVHIIFAIIDSKESQYLRLNYTVSTLLALSTISPLYSPGIQPYYGVRYITIPGPIYYGFVLFLCWCAYLTITRTLSALNKIKAGEKNNQFRYLLVAILIIVAAALAYFAMTMGVKIVPIDNWLNVAYGAIMAYAIVKEELLDIRVIIGRNATYVLVGILLAASFIALNALLMPAWLAMLTNTLLALFWSWAAHRLREFIQTPVDKWISWYKPDELLNSIVKELGVISGSEEAFQVIAKQLKSKIKIKDVKVVLGKKDGHPLPFEYVLSEKEVASPAVLPSNHPFIARLNGPMHYDKLTPEIRESIKEFNFLKERFYLPVFSSEALEGIIILGQKVSEDPYNKTDCIFFETLTIQVKAVLDRIRPYEEIKKELEATQGQLERSQRLAAIGTLTAGVTHEIRNPLTAIRAQTQRLAKEPRDNEYLKQHAELIVSQVDRVTGIVNKMLGLAKAREKQSIDVDLVGIINSTLPFFPIGKIVVKKDLSPLPFIKGDPEELREVFVNLIQNAIDAMPGGGTLTLTSFRQDQHNIVEISDTGKGIAPELQEKIFDPFFSTRHEGTGLGLSIVYRIVRQHGGEISVKSEVGKGTTFRLVF